MYYTAGPLLLYFLGGMGLMLDRRRFLSTCSGLGLGATLFPGALLALADGAGTITKDMIEEAARIADVAIPEEYRAAMLESLTEQSKGFEEIFKLHIPNHVPPALVFNPVLPSTKFERTKRPLQISAAPPAIGARGVPKNLDDAAFSTVRELAEWVRTRKVSSTALTEMYLERLKRYDPTLKFVITLTEDRAKAKAKEADREIAAGKYRGPLHGLPWGAKDWLAGEGYPTTVGWGGCEKRVINDETVWGNRLGAWAAE